MSAEIPDNTPPSKPEGGIENLIERGTYWFFAYKFPKDKDWENSNNYRTLKDAQRARDEFMLKQDRVICSAIIQHNFDPEETPEETMAQIKDDMRKLPPDRNRYQNN